VLDEIRKKGAVASAAHARLVCSKSTSVGAAQEFMGHLYRVMAIGLYLNLRIGILMTDKSVSDLRIKILSALSDPTRLDLLEYLSEGERCVCEILPAFQRSQSTISKHLNILYEADILERKIDGKRTLYRIKDSQVFDLIRLVDTMALKQISELAEAGRILEKSLNSGR
jgi:ArsR family transcriptional regulator